MDLAVGSVLCCVDDLYPVSEGAKKKYWTGQLIWSDEFALVRVRGHE